MPVLTGLDVLGIQSYIFASNRLRDVLSASWMVAHVTDEPFIHQADANAKILLAAGGNAVLEFQSLEQARAWTTRYTRRLLDEAPGLEVAVTHLEYDEGGLAEALKDLQRELAYAKLARRPGVPQLGLSVNEPCAVTGLPAVCIDNGAVISRPIQALRAHRDDATERWDDFLPEGREEETCFPIEVDHLGRTVGDSSLVAIVHVDGNSVGKRISDWLDRCIDEARDDDDVRQEYSAWSGDIEELGKHVLKRVVGRVVNAVDAVDSREGVVSGVPEHLGFRLHCEDGKLALPIRPLLLGGDDLTFVCDGRVALDLAVAALRAFDDLEIRHLGEKGHATKLTACAGVAFMGAHAPFYRNYELCEKLCASAKRYVKEKHKNKDSKSGSCIDWHVGASRPSESIETIREREYSVRDAVKREDDSKQVLLTMRPYLLDGEHSWKWLDQDVLGPGADGAFRSSRWMESRNRIKAIPALLVQGGEILSRQLEAWRAIDGKTLSFPAGIADDGMCSDGRSPLLDAIELLDLHLRLEPTAHAHDTTQDAAEGRE